MAIPINENFRFWKRASKWIDDNVDKFLVVILPKVGLIYPRPDDAEVETEENLQEEDTETDDEDGESNERTEEFRGRYCVFCSKIDQNMKKKNISPGKRLMSN
ncbi:putative serine-threonine protein kinase, plant-type [Corchorus capsularis]|uniref:Putative serine-threonine protein kinase, plant-type n=1 Tax=Corchorus capsularis TaxID=210143 RepID=A0A1R3IR04_COCAP|nr:putative serine-threonine protein kinase, plant-type [Corchorus capsularis]